jgi:hypothetical protein
MATSDIFDLVQQFDKMRQGLGTGGGGIGRPQENPKVIRAYRDQALQQQRAQQAQAMRSFAPAAPSGGGGAAVGPYNGKLDLVDWGGKKFHRSIVPFLQDFHSRFGTLRVSSGYRDPQHNARVNGVKNSRHLLGRAADFSGSMKDMQAAAAWARARGVQTLIHNAGSGTHLHLEWD